MSWRDIVNRVCVALPAALLIALLVGSARANAQTPPTKRELVVRVHVADTSGAPVAGAEVSVHADQSTLASAVVDETGRRVLTVPGNHREFDVVVRRLGFLREDRFFLAGESDTLSFGIVMHRAIATLGPVVVSAEVLGRQHDYNIDADEIAKSSRELLDVNDIIQKLRPMMWTSRAPGVCSGSHAEPYAALSNLYVNGRRVPVIKQYKAPDTPAATPVFMPGHAGAASLDNIPVADNDWIRAQVTELLHLIKPEHVAEMHYLDCYDTWIDDINGTNALYIILKPGIGYDPARGSYVIPPVPARKLADASRIPSRGGSPATVSQLLRQMFPPMPSPAQSPTSQASAKPLTPTPSNMPPYRSRVIGVFAVDGGAPLGGVAIVDDSVGLQTFTLPTGAASLAFLPEGASRIRLTKPGYRDTSFVVSIAPADTVPLTVLLEVSDTSRKTPRLLH